MEVRKGRDKSKLVRGLNAGKPSEEYFLSVYYRDKAVPASRSHSLLSACSRARMLHAYPPVNI